MNDERWTRITALYEAAQERAPGERSAFISQAAAGDSDLRREVESLLAQDLKSVAIDEHIAAAARSLLADNRAVQPGSFIGPYRIDSLLGVGGMGEVYRAHDPKLNRAVAIKILPPAFANDPDRLARFKREAQVLASLNHPNVGGIYGFEDADGIHALILELVEGPTLADLVSGVASGFSRTAATATNPAKAGSHNSAASLRALPVDEALSIARQIADALEAAHEQGVIHRDLKPANIKVREDGTVKVLDFGLAKLADPVGATLQGGPSMTQSPTITTPAMTAAGMILGTAAYMSPEQAKGRPADKRSDVWAFGCVLYEMLTGKRAFDGEDVSDTLAAILRAEPDWNALTEDVPAHVRLLLRKCLEKDRGRRISDISTARFLITERVDQAIPAGASDARQSGSATVPRWRRTIPALVSVIVVSAIVGDGVWVLKRSPPQQGVTRLTFPLPDGQQFTNAGRKLVALSRDGTKMAYVANGRLYLKTADRLDATAMSTVEASGEGNGVTTPAFSPDGRWIAFWSGSGAVLQKVASTGGAPVTLCSAENPYGISWDGDSLLFGEGSKGIMRVAATGGTPELLVPAKDNELLAAPEMLPGGRMLLYTASKGAVGLDWWDKAQVVVQTLGSSERFVVVDGGSDAHYVATGHLIYAVGGTLFGVPFDLQHARVTGSPAPVVEGVRRAANGVTSAANFGVSDTGALVYVPGSAEGLSTRDLALLDRKGGIEPLKLSARQYAYPRVSPDGSRVAVTVGEGTQSDIWIYDLKGASGMSRLTFGGHNRFPSWTSDSARVAFQSDRDGEPAIFWQRADAPGSKADRLTTPEKGEAHIPNSWSPKDDVLLFTVVKGSENAMWTFSLADKKAVSFGNVRESGTQPNGAFSPDGRWVAYNHLESTGRPPLVIVQPFPAIDRVFQIGPGLNPMWSRDGKELLLSGGAGDGGNFEAITVSTERGFVVTGRASWPRPGAILAAGLPRNYDLLPDAQSFVIVVDSGTRRSAGAGLRIEYVLNWFEELKQKVPVPR
jgi:serine/threonine-protein kinase